MQNARDVFVQVATDARYPRNAPFGPSSRYPEYGFGSIGAEANSVYDAVRACFMLAGLDAAKYGSQAWNPLGELIRPGETVLLKPNLVKESHPRDPEGWCYVLTHGSVVRAVADYVFTAVGQHGKVVIADAPQTDSSFSRIAEMLGLRKLREFYGSHGLRLEVVDLRREEWTARDGVVVKRTKQAGDPSGEVAFDLAEQSEFAGHGGGGRYYGADYDTGVVNRHHANGRHEYPRRTERRRV